MTEQELRWTPWTQPCAPLLLCLTLTPSFDPLENIVGVPLFTSVIDFQGTAGTWYFREPEAASLGWRMIDFLMTPGRSDQIQSEIREAIDRLRAVTDRYSVSTDLSTKNEFLVRWRELTAAFYNFYRFGAFVEPVQLAAQPVLSSAFHRAHTLAEPLASEEDRQAAVSAAFSGGSETYVARMLERKLGLAQLIDEYYGVLSPRQGETNAKAAQTGRARAFMARSPELAAAAESFAAQYHWIENNYSGATRYTSAAAVDSILLLVNKDVSATEAVQSQLSAIQGNLERSTAARAALAPYLSDYESQLLGIHDRMGSELSDLRKECVQRFIAAAIQTLASVQKLFGHTVEQMLRLVPEEVEDYASAPESYTERLQRRESRMIVYRAAFSVLDTCSGPLGTFTPMREPIVAEGSAASSLLADLDVGLELFASAEPLTPHNTTARGTSIFWSDGLRSLRGRTSVVRDPRTNAFETGSVLVATSTTPDFLPMMLQASAIVTEWGGQTSHAALTAREFGIPCIVGVRDATTLFPSGSEIEIDFAAGEVELLGGPT